MQMDRDTEAQLFFAEEAIKASNRTTHAIRAITKFIVFEAAYSLGVGILLVVALGPVASLEEPHWFIVFLAGVLAIVGLVHSFAAAFTELNNSEVTWSVLPGRLRRASSGKGDTFTEPLPDDEADQEEVEAFEERARADRSRYERLYGLEEG